MNKKIILPVFLISSLGLMVNVSAISCGDNKCENLIFELNEQNPSKTIEINGYQETFTYKLEGGPERFDPTLYINGKYYSSTQDPLYKEKGYYVSSTDVIYKGEIVNFTYNNETHINEKPSGVKVTIDEKFYCKASDCRKEQTIIKLEKGWNLVQQYQIWFQDFSQTTCNLNNKGHGYFFSPFNKDYIYTNFRSTDAIEANIYDISYFGLSSDEYWNKLSTYQFIGDLNSFWIYSEESCKIVLNYPDYYESTSPPDSLQLFSENTNGNSRRISEGWNFLSVYTLLNGNDLNNTKGNCQFEKAYFFDAQSQEWEPVALDYKFSTVEIGKGLIVKNSFECIPNFRVKGSSQNPPSIPN